MIDSQGEEIPLWIEYDQYNGAAIESLEELRPGRGDCLTVILRNTPGLHLFRVAVIRGEGLGGVESFGLKQKEIRSASWLEKMSRRFTRMGSPVLAGEAIEPANDGIQEDSVFQILVDFLLARAESGTRRFNEEDRRILEPVAQRRLAAVLRYRGAPIAAGRVIRHPVCLVAGPALRLGSVIMPVLELNGISPTLTSSA